MIKRLKIVLFSGFRQFQANLANATATLRSRASIKSEDDQPPPYEAQISPQIAQQSPPPYHVAIAMVEDHAQDDLEQDQDLDQIEQDPENDETDSKINFAAKKVARLSSVKK